MSNIYEAPDSNLSEDSGSSAFGSLEQGIAGDYELSIGSVFSDGWAMVKGNKGTCWIAVFLLIVSMIVINFGTGFILGLLPLPESLSAIVVQIVVTLLTTPLNVGLSIVAIKLASDAKASGTSIFNYFGLMIKLFLAILLMYLLIVIGFILLVLPGIYLSFSYMFALALIAEKNLGIWEALEASRKAVTHKWFVVFFTFLLIGIIVSVSAMALLIGLIWTVPFSLLAFGLMYRTIFGVEQSTLDSE